MSSLWFLDPCIALRVARKVPLRKHMHGVGGDVVEQVFVEEEHIYPCVDIGVGDILEDGSLLIIGSVAGSAPRPFGPNWTGLLQSRSRTACYLRVLSLHDFGYQKQ